MYGGIVSSQRIELCGQGHARCAAVMSRGSLKGVSLLWDRYKNNDTLEYGRSLAAANIFATDGNHTSMSSRARRISSCERDTQGVAPLRAPSSTSCGRPATLALPRGWASSRMPPSPRSGPAEGRRTSHFTHAGSDSETSTGYYHSHGRQIWKSLNHSAI